MRIAINTRFLLKDKLEGIGRFTFESFKIITQQHPEHEFFFIFDRPYDQKYISGKNVKGIVVPPPARHPVLWYIWFEISIPGILKKIKPDLFLSPDSYLSLSTDLPQIIVIHDLAFEHYPNDIPWLVRKYYKYFTPKYALKATRILTVSEFSKQDISKRYNIPKDKIDVVHNGSRDGFTTISDSRKKQIKEKLSMGKDYFFYLGALHQRKNIGRMLLAFDLFKEKDIHGIKLVIGGRKAWGNKEMENIFDQMKFKDDVIFTGWVTDEEATAYMASCLAFIYLSYFEGFGIPVLEAMNTGVPVICSNRSSLPEVAGRAALLCNPENILEIKNALDEISTNDLLRKKLIDEGNLQKKKFNWEKTANQIWQNIEDILVK